MLESLIWGTAGSTFDLVSFGRKKNFWMTRLPLLSLTTWTPLYPFLPFHELLNSCE